MSAEEQVFSRYKGEAGEEYVRERQNTVDYLGYRIDMEFFQPYLKPEHTALDFGAGNGGPLNVVKDWVDTAEGLEVNPAAAQVARDATGCTIYGDLSEVPDDRYDVVFTNHVLEHVPDVPKTLGVIRSKIKPGGLILVKLPYDDWRDHHQRGWQRNDTDYHLHSWSPRQFANNLYEAGFDVQECRMLTFAWDPRLFWTRKYGLDKLAFKLMAIYRHRRQLFAVAKNPA